MHEIRSDPQAVDQFAGCGDTEGEECSKIGEMTVDWKVSLKR